MESTDKRTSAEEFVTVVNVQGTQQSTPSSAESFVTVLSIGTGSKQQDKLPEQTAANGVDPAHPEEEVEVYRLPGERLGFGLKFEGGNKTSEKVRRLFIQSCAEQSPASRAKCSWGNLGEGDEVLSIDEVPVTQMTRLDCVRRLKESQLVIKLAVRCRGALRPEVVSAERKPQQRSKVPPELPAAPPPVPPRKLRRDPTQAAVNRGLADGEASPGMKKACDSPKSTGSSNTGSPQSQGSFRSAASSIRSSNYESCVSSPVKSGPGSKSESPKDSPKVHVSPVLNKIKQEPPAEAQSYLDARSQDGSSTHGSTSDDTSSSLSTVVDRFSSSDRFSTTSTTSTTSEQLVVPPTEIDVNGDALLLSNGVCMDLSNPSDFLLTRLANSEARTHVESRGEVERVTTVVAPNTVLIEDTPALQPPLSFQDAPLSYGHEARPGIFYSADLAADSRTHFRPIKDDAEIVEKVVNGEAPPLPARNHVNRIPINQQEPPKPMPRKELKAKRKRPPPPPPPPRREPPPPVPEARNVDAKKKKEEDEAKSEEEATKEDKQPVKAEESEHAPTNKVLEIVEMKKVKSMSPMKPPSRTSDECEVPNRGVEASDDGDVEEESSREQAEVELRNSINRKMLADMSSSSTVSMEVEVDSDEEKRLEMKEDSVEVVEEVYEETVEVVINGQDVSQMDEGSRVDEELAEEMRIVDRRRSDEKDMVDDEDVSDESDGDDYYWQSNLATIGEEEENNSLEYEDANEDPIPPVLPVETPKAIENVIESAPDTLDKNAAGDEEEEEQQQQQQSNEEDQSVRRIERDSVVEDKKQDKSAVNVRMDNCGGGGQRLPPDGDEFPAAYQEFISPNHQHQHQQQQQQQQYQYVTTRETMAANGDVDRGESVLDTGKTGSASSLMQHLVSKDTAALLIDTVDGSSRTLVSNYVLYGTQKTIVAEKKIEIAGYYSKDANDVLDVESEASAPPPPLPLTGPPKVDGKPDRKFSSSNGDLWRQDNRSEASVKDKIAMFSSQSSLEAPLFPATPVSSPVKRLSKHKSSDDVFAEDKRSAMCERTQSSFDLSGPVHQKSPSLPQTSPPSSPSGYPYNGYLNQKSPLTSSNGSSKSSSPLNSYTANYANGSNKSFDGTLATSPSKTQPNGLTRATSFSGSTTAPYGYDRLQTSSELLANNNQNGNGTAPVIARTNSLVATFKRPSDEIRKSSLNQLIEQRRKGISKLRGLVIPEKDALPVDQPIIDLPEIKSRDSILNNQAPRANIQDKWGSQSSLASNASTVSSSVRTGSTFKMPAPKILSNYSPAFKRKSLSVYGSNNQPNNNNNNNNSQTSPPLINGTKSPNTTNNQLVSPASDAPKSLESICSPTRSDYSFDFVSSGGSPDGGNPPNSRLQIHSNKQLSNCQRKLGSRNEYDDSDNDSAVSSSQSSISRGFSPPMSPVPSDRSTISSSERSYLSSDNNYPQQRPQLILDNGTKNGDSKPGTLYTSPRSNLMAERSFSVPEKKPLQEQQQPTVPQQTMIPQRQMLKRSSSTDTTSSNCSSSTITSASQAESLSRRVLKAQSVEAINRKNILASARCRSGRDLNGSPLIQRKFNDEEEAAAAAAAAAVQGVNGEFVSAHRLTNGDVDGAKPQIKIAYIEITENVVAEGGKKEEEEAMVPQQQPRLPPKRSVIPQAKNVPIPTSRPPKPEPLETSNDMKSWVRAEMRSLATNNSSIQDSRKNTSLTCDVDAPNARNFKSKSTLALNEPTPRSQVEPETKPRTSLSPKKSSVDDHNDLLTVLTTKSRSRSAIHVVEDSSSYGKLKSQMSLEDILAVSSANSSSSSVLTQPPKLLPRSQSISCDSNGRNGLAGPPFCAVRNGTVDSWTTEDKISPTKIPSLRSKQQQEVHEVLEGPKSPTTSCSKIPTSRNLGRRSASVTDMKKVFERPEASSSGTSSPGSQSQISGSSTATHNRFPSLDSSVEDSIRPEVDQERFSGEQFGSISSLASSTSLISQQELAQLVEEANLEEPRGGHDVVVVLLHKENPAGSVGITLAGGLDCETKEITIHRVLAHSIADRDGSVQRGDRILSINGRSMRGLTHRESLAVLKQPRSEVVLVVSRAKLDDAAAGNRLRNRTESVETIVEGYETNGVTENTAWGPALMVSMYKDGAGLGFSLEGGRDSPLGDRPLLIKKIFTGGAAEKTGALRAGDQLLEVNKRDVSRMSRIEAWSLMKKLPDGEVNLLVRHPATKSS